MNLYFQKNYARSFGTYPLKGEFLKEAMQCAVAVGYRAFDTAQMYGNEEDMGAALRSIGISRQELCITTKVHPNNFPPERFILSVKESLKKLQMDEVDALLLHWPPLGESFTVSLQLLEEATKLGLTRNVGVSNYTAQMMRQARQTMTTPLVTNQVEFHPLLDQSALLQAAKETGIPLSSYCSVARGAVFKYPLFSEIGQSYGKTAAQVVLRWILQRGIPINTMSTKEDNIRSNYDVMDFTLSSIDMAKIDQMNSQGYRVVDSTKAVWAPQWD